MPTNKQYQALGESLVKNKYATTTNCVELRTKIQNLQSEIATRTELRASSACDNKFKKGLDDCKREQNIFLPLLRKAEIELKQAYNNNKCELVFGDIESKKTQDQIDLASESAEAGLGSKLRLQEYLIYGVGLLAVGFGIYYFIKRKSK